MLSWIRPDLQINNFIFYAGSHLFVSAEGEFEVIKGKSKVDSFGPGVIFGELAILYNSKRLASIRGILQFQEYIIDNGET